jgi:hypothetical protein
MFEEVAVELDETKTPVAAGEPHEARVGQRIPGFMKVQIAASIPLPGQRDDGVRADPNGSVGAPIHMHTKEREGRIWDWINQVAAEPPSLWTQCEVIAAEGNDPHAFGVAADQGVRMDSSAGHDVGGLDLARLAPEHDRVRALVKVVNPRAERDLTTGLFELAGERLRDEFEVDKPGAG